MSSEESGKDPEELTDVLKETRLELSFCELQNTKWSIMTFM